MPRGLSRRSQFLLWLLQHQPEVIEVVIEYETDADADDVLDLEEDHELAEKLTNEEYQRDVSAFFKSMHGTLNHILVADRVWMKRFTGSGAHPSTLDAIIADEGHSFYKSAVKLKGDLDGMIRKVFH